MKKKVTLSRKSSANGKRTLPRRSKASDESAVMVQRIVIISACVVIAVVAGLLVNTHKSQVGQSVAGLSVARGLFAQATIDIPEVDGAISYNIYYKKSNENAYNNAVRNIPTGTKSYTVSYLKKGTDYDHKIVAVDATGKEFWFSPSRPILGIESM